METETRFRTIEETAKLFERYAYAFEGEARNIDDKEESQYLYGKADAYRTAAFELRRNCKEEM